MAVRHYGAFSLPLLLMIRGNRRRIQAVNPPTLPSKCPRPDHASTAAVPRASRHDLTINGSAYLESAQCRRLQLATLDVARIGSAGAIGPGATAATAPPQEMRRASAPAAQASTTRKEPVRRARPALPWHPAPELPQSQQPTRPTEPPTPGFRAIRNRQRHSPAAFSHRAKLAAPRTRPLFLVAHLQREIDHRQ